MQRRRFTLRAAALCLAPAWPARSAVAWRPARALTIVLPFPAGGGPDLEVRALAEGLGARLGQRVLVENVPGAGGLLAAQRVARAQADGQSLLYLTSGILATQAITRFPIDVTQAFRVIGRTSLSCQVLVVPTPPPWRDLARFIESMRGQAAPPLYASGGIGTPSHLAAAAFCDTFGIRAEHVPFRAAVDYLPALVRRGVAFAFPIVGPALPLVRDGRLEALAVTSPARLPALAQTPTFAELGYAPPLPPAWGSLAVPAATSAEAIQALHDALDAAKGDPAYLSLLEREAAIPAPTQTVAQTRTDIEAEHAAMVRLVTRLHIVGE